MAQLVKLAAPPQKYFLARKEQLWPLNQIITQKTAQNKLYFLRKNNALTKQIARIINLHLETRAHELIIAHERGSKTTRERAAAEIIALALLWHNNIKEESNAMLKLTHTLSEIMLNTQLDNLDFLKNNLHENITRYLCDYFYITLYLKDTHIKNNNLEPVRVLIDTHNKLEIFIAQDRYSVDLSGLDIRRIMARVKKNMSSGHS
jgi:hypothetical protein